MRKNNVMLIIGAIATVIYLGNYAEARHYRKHHHNFHRHHVHRVQHATCDVKTIGALVQRAVTRALAPAVAPHLRARHRSVQTIYITINVR